jgi:uncharacterized protein (TIGR02145 family)
MSKIQALSIVILAVFGMFSISSCEKHIDYNLPVDADGNIYDTVAIGNQVWLKENLKTTTYIDSTPIPLLTDNDEWSSTRAGAFCWYNNDPKAYKDTYGALYNWYSVETGLLCPIGWHVPTNEDWSVLIGYLAGQNLAGSKMKEEGTVHWNSPNLDANNISGFTALPGGYRGKTGGFSSINYYCRFWSSTEGDSTWASNRSLEYSGSHVGSDGFNKAFGFSVRCIKD